ncbi:phage tail protein [Collimonas humicola]|uniref:phage tail protein n=1 Tax=Collimonas humicola TaxID=2825886 RepID=UPI001B8DA0F1|nr:phage tail protein [Collimonas humicola]
MSIFQPEVSRHFLATFFFEVTAGTPKIPSMIDMRFQSISGLGRTTNVRSVYEGGENVGAHHLPEQIVHNELVFTRGVMLLSPLTMVFGEMLSDFKVRRIDVVIMLLNARLLPKACWSISDAVPSGWDTGALDANDDKVLINTFKLRYRDITRLGIVA